ncbi:cell surface glycoprotein 1-like isoform X2 [Pectinophora gossypiella]|uniref:cell surface glycoprotein 1-like isoform X2 n=1 Tax=Pectinophora gossypiella TaxID=13191 RepID=UPI00214EAAC4|nr:cell surface glycoprotein 1-like isoform X2 [Pectinophora gossypiella]
MGAKQSKRSVDISGKEAEGAGEVAAAGAGGEGRVEALADADALKPQINGDAHIHEQTEKEKQLDSGTPENEKDATTEKEGKEAEEEGDKDKEVAPVTNGDTEPKPENGDSPAPEDGKKPKKEKAAEVTPENAASEVAEEAKPEAAKEEKTPETPVTEPLTNGSSTPESAKAESPAIEEPAAPVEPVVAPTPEAPVDADKPEPKAVVQPDQLPVNGLSLEEPKTEVPEAKLEESKPEEPIAEKTETAPVPEIPVIKEVCVEQMPLEPSPPPLPANPPPSSVVSFAATTMAPELTDASLANTAELAISAPTTVPDTDAINHNEPLADLTELKCDNNTESVATELPPPPKEEKSDEIKTEVTLEVQPALEKSQPVAETVHTEKAEPEPEAEKIPEVEVQKAESLQEELNTPELEKTEEKIDNVTLHVEDQPEVETVGHKIETVAACETAVTKVSEVVIPEVHTIETIELSTENITPPQELNNIQDEPEEIDMPPAPESDKIDDISEPSDDTLDSTSDLPPPPPMDVDVTDTETTNHTEPIVLNGVNNEQLNGNDDTQQENLKNKTKDLLENAAETVECNGNIEEKPRKERAASPAGDAGVPVPPAAASPAPPAASPPPPAAAATQEPMPVADKLADLIPEVPVVPELNTESETTTDVAVTN